ncbi:MAG: ATP phosphoribosyltransferase [Synergistales bacterium]|nr:ATP phosphoribosyltransferase [Synergistales bacterium]
MLTFALPTGRILDEAITILHKAGLPVEALQRKGRNLVVEDRDIQYILAKPMDVPLYVHYGVAQLGLAGSDVLWERNTSVMELQNTGIGRCRLAIAGHPRLRQRFLSHESSIMGLRVATKYPRVAEDHFAKRGVQVEILALQGSIELAPRLGLADCILDIVQSGETLTANGLIVLEEVAQVSARLVASKKAARLLWPQLHRIIEAIERGHETGAAD